LPERPTSPTLLFNKFFEDHHDRAREAQRQTVYPWNARHGARRARVFRRWDDEILRDFPELTREDIKACLAFAADRERKLFVAPA